MYRKPNFSHPGSVKRRCEMRSEDEDEGEEEEEEVTADGSDKHESGYPDMSEIG